VTTHNFEVEEAEKYGMGPAVLLSNIRFWLIKNKANRDNAHDGYYWTYNSARAFAELFPYMTRSTIARYLKQLCDQGVLLSGNYNKKGFDQTIWYTIPNEFAISQNEQCISQNEQPISQNETTIPDTKTQIENTTTVLPPPPKKESNPDDAMKWVEFFMNKKGFQFHEAQTASTMIMYREWVKDGITVDDVELADIDVRASLGGDRPDTPKYYKNFVKKVILEKQKSLSDRQRSHSGSPQGKGGSNYERKPRISPDAWRDTDF
jgi:hypothetical protein